MRYSGTAIDNEAPNPNTRIRATKTATDETLPVNGKYLAVSIPPMTSVRLACGLKRFANDPSYAFPWHGVKVPIE